MLNKYYKGREVTKTYAFKEFELGVTQNDFVSSKKAMWNGGDGVDWIIEKPKIRAKFVQRNLLEFIDGPVDPPELLPAMNNWIDEQLIGMEELNINNRQVQFIALRNKYGLPLIAWGEPDNINNLPVDTQARYLDEKYQIEKDFFKEHNNFLKKRLSMKKDYRDAQINLRKEIDAHDRKCADCAALFNELFGPAVLVHINTLLSQRHFDDAWDRLDTIYNVSSPNMIRTGIIKKLNLVRYNPQEITLSGLFQKLEELWEPLLAPAVGGYSDDEKIEHVRKALEGFKEMFGQIIDHCRRSNFNYEQTKAMLLREANHIMADIIEKQNNEDMYKEITFNKMEPIEEINYVASERSNNKRVRCFYCHELGHTKDKCKHWIAKRQRMNYGNSSSNENENYKKYRNEESGYKSDQSERSRGSIKSDYSRTSGKSNQSHNSNNSYRSNKSQDSQNNRRVRIKNSSSRNEDEVNKKKEQFYKKIKSAGRKPSSKQPDNKTKDRMKSPKRFGAMVAETGEGKTNKLSQRSIDLGKTLLDYIRKDVNKKDEIKRVYENRNSLSGWELSMENSVGHESTIKDLVVYGCTTAGDGLKTIQGEMGVYLSDMSCSITKYPCKICLLQSAGHRNRVVGATESLWRLKPSVCEGSCVRYRSKTIISVKEKGLHHSPTPGKGLYHSPIPLANNNRNDYENEISKLITKCNITNNNDIDENETNKLTNHEFLGMMRSQTISKQFKRFKEDFYEKETIINESNLIDKLVISDIDDYYGRRKPNENFKIIFDSGASTHLCPDLSMFDEIIDTTGIIKFANNKFTRYYGKGKIGILKDILWVPEIDGLYISCGKLDEDGYTITIKDNLLKVIDANNETILIGRKLNGLYYYDEIDEENTVEELNELTVVEGSAPKKSKTSVGNMKEIDYLHHRWGHPNERAIKEGLRRKKVIGALAEPEVINQQTLSYCPDCIRGKMHNLTSKPSETDYDDLDPMEHVATDNKGPLPFQSLHNQYRYYDIFVFRSSHYIMIKFKRTKEKFYDNFLEIIKEVKKLGHEIKALQTDDDGLYKAEITKKILDKYNITKRTSVAYHHYSNGWPERHIRTIMEKATTMMLIYNCPVGFWPEAIKTAAYLHNRTPLKDLEWDTPYKRVHGIEPDISNLVPFYAPGMAFLPKENRTSPLGAKALECRMLGYDEEAKNGYIIWVPQVKKKMRAVNCKFIEGINFEVRSEEDENRDFTRFKFITEEDLGERIEDHKEFLKPPSEEEEEDEPYWKSENIDKSPGEYDEFTESENEEDLDEELDYIESINSISKELELPPVPSSIDEALRGENSNEWEKAIHEELDQLLQYEALKIVTPQEGEHIAQMKFVLATKLDNDFKIRFKARLVIKGFSQQYGYNYLTTYAPTIGKDSFRIVIIYILKHNMLIEFYDYKYAFVEGYNDYRILGKLPKDLFPEQSEDIIVEVIRSLYGEKQAAHIWYMRLKEILCEEMNFENLLHDEAIFVKRNDKDEIRIIITVHVDDLLVATYTSEEQDEFMEEMKLHVRDIKRFEEAKKYLGVEIVKSYDTVYLKQENYIKDIIKNLTKSEQEFIKNREYPLNPNYKITDIMDIEEETETLNILSLIGKLRYVIDCTRIDAMATLGMVSEHATEATYSQVSAAFKLLSFLYTTRVLSLKLHSNRENDLTLFAFCDASHNVGNGKSRLGGVFYLSYESGPISCYSKKDIAVSNSAMEAEVRSIERTVRQIIIYRELLEELGHKQLEPTIIYTDSEASVKFFKHYRNSKKLRHIMKLIHTIRVAINDRIIKLVYIKTEYNVADILTKLLGKKDFNRLQEWILYGYNEMHLKYYVKESNKKESVHTMMELEDLSLIDKEHKEEQMIEEEIDD